MDGEGGLWEDFPGCDVPCEDNDARSIKDRSCNERPCDWESAALEFISIVAASRFL